MLLEYTAPCNCDAHLCVISALFPIKPKDLKYQTAAILAQEQSRRATTFASNRKPATSAIPLSSPSSQYNKDPENKLRSICNTELNIPSIDRQNISQNHHISNHIRKSRQQNNTAQSSRYMLNPSEPVTHLNEHRRDGVDGNRDMAPSEQFQVINLLRQGISLSILSRMKINMYLSSLIGIYIYSNMLIITIILRVMQFAAHLR